MISPKTYSLQEVRKKISSILVHRAPIWVWVKNKHLIFKHPVGVFRCIQVYLDQHLGENCNTWGTKNFFYETPGGKKNTLGTKIFFFQTPGGPWGEKIFFPKKTLGIENFTLKSSNAVGRSPKFWATRQGRGGKKFHPQVRRTGGIKKPAGHVCKFPYSQERGSIRGYLFTILEPYF